MNGYRTNYKLDYVITRRDLAEANCFSLYKRCKRVGLAGSNGYAMRIIQLNIPLEIR